MPVFRLEFGEADVDLNVKQRDELDVNLHVYIHPPEGEDERGALSDIAESLGDGDVTVGVETDTEGG